MIHRPFIFRSFQSARFAYTRRTCISAAMTILRELKGLTDNGDVFLWTHSAFCVTAALILSFEIAHYRVEQEESCSVYSNAVEEALQFLASREQDVMAQRGVFLIKAILSTSSIIHDFSAVSNIDEAESVSFEGIVFRFAVDLTDLGFLTQPVDSPQILHQQEPGYLSTYEIEEFETWFQGTFYEA
jgi:hypothetical protein